MSKVSEQPKERPLRMINPDLDLAWQKTQNGLEQEAEGRKLWIEGTLELINILHKARKRLGADQAFGDWLTALDYDERITRHDRSALLNMAEHLDLTRNVLEETTRRSWQLIWREEMQPRLPSGRQPPEAKGPAEAPEGTEPEAPDGEGAEEPQATTRRPKKPKGAKKTANEEQVNEWSGDSKHFFRAGLVTAHDAIAMKNTVLQCTVEQKRKLQKDVEPSWQEIIGKGGEALLWLCEFFKAPLDEAADTLIREGRVRTIPARRASAPTQPSA
jgi:hypothetical protein